MKKLVYLGLFLLVGCGGSNKGSQEALDPSFKTTQQKELFFVTPELSSYVNGPDGLNTCAQWATSQMLVDFEMLESVTVDFYEAMRIAMKNEGKGTQYDPHEAWLETQGLEMSFFKINSCIDYGTLASFEEKGCEIGLGMYVPEIIGHFETIVQVFFDPSLEGLDTSDPAFYDATNCGVKTNSWGKLATAQGFTGEDTSYVHTNMTMYNGTDTDVYGYVVCKVK